MNAVASVDEVTPAWLERVLAARGGGPRISRVAIRAQERTDKLFFLEAESDRGPLRFVLKLVSTEPLPDRILPGVREALAKVFRTGPEVDFYALTVGRPRVPWLLPCHLSEWDPQRRYGTLLLDDVSATHSQTECPLTPSLSTLESQAEVLAAVHAQWWAHPDLERLVPGTDALPELVEATRKVQATLLEDIPSLPGLPIPAFCARILEGLPARLRSRRLSRERVTLVHGDAHCWNFLGPREGAGLPLLIDWENFYVGAGAADLASLVALNVTPLVRQRIERALVERYHRKLVAGGVTGYSLEACREDYRLGLELATVQVLVRRAAGMPAFYWWPMLQNVASAAMEAELNASAR